MEKETTLLAINPQKPRRDCFGDLYSAKVAEARILLLQVLFSDAANGISSSYGDY